MKPSLQKSIALFLVIFFHAGVYSWSQTLPQFSTATELKNFYDIIALPAYRTQTFSAQVSTYDTTGGNNDGFNGDYSFIRRNSDSSLVIFDVKGAGVINRFWTPTPTTDTLDFYIDDSLRPNLSICYMDLFSGKVFPFVPPLCGNQLGGYYCYYPILFQKHCMIVSRGKTMQFHQIQYRLYQQGSTVQPFSLQSAKDGQTGLQKIETLWSKADKNAIDFVTPNILLQTVNATVNLQPGQSKIICSITKGGRIAGIQFSPADVFEGLYKNIDIRIFWDDETIPAVDCPAADFFGFAFGKPSMQSLLLGTANKHAYCYFPMPFDKKARIELRYRKPADKAVTLPSVQINATVNYTLQPRLPQLEGKLYANWQQERTRPLMPHVFLDAKGKGHYVATILQAQGLHPGMTIFFEGDDSTVIDGKLRLHGTGSEDYFNGGWYALPDRWDAKMSLPLHGALDYSLLFSRTGGYRLYMNDKLSFEKSFYHTIEHGPEHNNIPALYTSVCFYYADRPSQNAMKPGDADTKVYLPDTLNIYPQFTKVSVGENMVLKTTYDDASIGQSFDMMVNNESWLRLSLEDVPAGKYKIFADYINQPDGCSFSVWQRQSVLSGLKNTYAAQKTKEENKWLSDILVTELNKTITLRFTTTETQHHFTFSRLMLVKQ